MKISYEKKFCFIAAVVIAVGSKSFISNEVRDDISLMNIEALSMPEHNKVICMDVGCVDCPATQSKVKYVYELSSVECVK